MLEDAGNPGSIIIQIRDHEPGVPEEMLSHILEPFVRVRKPEIA